MAYNTACVHRLRSFAEAKAWFEKVKPIRGNAEGVRPYGSRRHWHMASIEMPDENTVVLKYYNAPLVVWKSDDSFSVHPPKYYSAYAADHLHWYLPFERGFFEWNKGRMFISQNDGKKYHLPRTSTGLKFQKLGNKFFMLNKPVEYNVRKDRTAYKHAIAKYKPFLDWAGAVLSINNKVVGADLKAEFNHLLSEAGLASEETVQKLLYGRDSDSIPQDIRQELYGTWYAYSRLPFRGYGNCGAYTSFHRETCEVLDSWVTSDNPDLWVKALYAIGERQNSVYSWQSINNDPTYAVNLLPVTKYVETLCQYIHRDTIFKKVRLDDGAVPSKTNGQYFDPELKLVPKRIIDNLSNSPESVQ